MNENGTVSTSTLIINPQHIFAIEYSYHFGDRIRWWALVVFSHKPGDVIIARQLISLRAAFCTNNIIVVVIIVIFMESSTNNKQWSNF